MQKISFCLPNYNALIFYFPFSLVKSAEKVFKEAEKFDAKGDEESAFIMYMKYFNIVKVVRSSADYKKNKVSSKTKIIP